MKRKLKITLSIIWMLTVLFVLFLSFSPKFTRNISEHDVSTIDVWTIRKETREQQVLLPINLQEEQIELYTILPKEFENRQTICFWTRFQDVKVFLDGKQIYETEEELRLGESMVSLWNYVDIPDDMSGHVLEIKMTTPYKIYKTFLEKVVYGSAEEVHSWMHKTYGII